LPVAAFAPTGAQVSSQLAKRSREPLAADRELHTLIA
jgi:hypothetical protein